MNKKNNKGFTLLELLISIFILTTVIFLGYKVINKSTMDIKNQGNINKGQLTMNNMNEYLTKDLEQASNIVLTYDSEQLNNEDLKEIFASYLQNEEDEPFISYLQNEEDKPFIYIYKIDKQNEDVEYSVEVVKGKNDYRYNVSRKESDGVSITFINNEIIKKDEISEEYSMNIEIELPFEISLDSPYKVYLGYNGKNDKFIRHEFTVASRLNSVGGDGSTNPDTGGNENSGGNGSANPDTGGNENSGGNGSANPDTGGNENSGGNGSTNPDTGGNENSGGNGSANPDTGGNENSGGSTSDLDGDIIFEFTRDDSLSQSSNQTRLNTIIKVKDEKGTYIPMHNQTTGNQDITQLSNNRIEIVISKSQIKFYTDSTSYPTINNNQIGKDLNNVKEVLIKIDKNVKVTYKPDDVQKISETEYKVGLRTDGQPSHFTFKFDITAYGTNKIAFTFIEG